MFSLSDSNVMWSLKLFNSFIRFSSSSLPWVHIKNTSSIYLNQTNGCYFCVLRKFITNVSIKMHAYGGANFVPIVIQEIWWNAQTQSSY